MGTPRDALISRLVEARGRPRLDPGVRRAAEELAGRALGLLFPHFAADVDPSPEGIAREMQQLEALLGRIHTLLLPHYPSLDPSVSTRFIEGLAEAYDYLGDDAQAIFEGDPAARSVDEVLLTYPGFYAIAVFRIANLLHRLGLPLVPRLLTELAHRNTGVDIHPAATIGRRFFIDHGTGVVIGETTLIGDGVKIYQGVTLGALTVEKSLSDRKRHPTLEDRVVVYANATILGGETVIGHDTVVAGNAWLTESVPPFSVVSRRAEVRPRDQGEGELDFSV
jgi:serine O-acetyltransferase